jgi:hypothetical protein
LQQAPAGVPEKCWQDSFLQSSVAAVGLATWRELKSAVLNPGGGAAGLQAVLISREK